MLYSLPLSLWSRWCITHLLEIKIYFSRTSFLFLSHFWWKSLIFELIFFLIFWNSKNKLIFCMRLVLKQLGKTLRRCLPSLYTQISWKYTKNSCKFENSACSGLRFLKVKIHEFVVPRCKLIHSKVRIWCVVKFIYVFRLYMFDILCCCCCCYV